MTNRDSSQGRAVFEQASAPKWRLLPREHGAYAQVIFPLLTALALGNRDAPQFLWTAAAVALFVAHEPLLILAGERGRRSHSELGKHAQKLAGSLSVAALVAGMLGWWHAPEAARLAMILPLGLGLFLLPLIVHHREKTLPGELLASLAFSTMLIPVALAGGVSVRAALIASAVWSIIFLLGTMMVRAVIANVKKATHSRWPVYMSNSLSLAAIVISFIMLLTGALPASVAAAALPAALITFACTLMEVHPRHLRTLGWSLVGSNVIALAALVMGLR
jgi:YwiC-like protein